MLMRIDECCRCMLMRIESCMLLHEDTCMLMRIDESCMMIDVSCMIMLLLFGPVCKRTSGW